MLLKKPDKNQGVSVTMVIVPTQVNVEWSQALTYLGIFPQGFYLRTQISSGLNMQS